MDSNQVLRRSSRINNNNNNYNNKSKSTNTSPLITQPDKQYKSSSPEKKQNHKNSTKLKTSLETQLHKQSYSSSSSFELSSPPSIPCIPCTPLPPRPHSSTLYQYLVNFDKAPEFMQDNPFIVTGYRKLTYSYRKTFQSLLYLHNETGNIYSHGLGAILFLGIFLWTVLCVVPVVSTHR